MRGQPAIQVREFFLELIDRLPAALSRPVERVIQWGKILLSIFSEFTVDAMDLHCRVGAAQEPLRLLLVGSRRRIAFFKELLEIDDCELRKKVRLFFWEVGEYMRRRDPEMDAVILNVTAVLYRNVKPQGYLRIPESLQSTLALHGPLDEVKERFRGSALRKVSDVIDRGYVCEVRKDEPALRHFYDEMYVPYIRTRFGELAVIDSFHKVRRLFRTGFLVAVRTHDTYLSAAVCRIRGNTLIFELIGIDRGRQALLRSGVMDALYYHCIIVAVQKGCTAINFGNSRPFLNDGLVLYKRKWGTAIRRNRKQYREIGIRYNLSREAGRRFFRQNCSVFLDDGGLSALVSSQMERPMDAREMKSLMNKYYSSGLKRLIVWSPRGFVKEVRERYGCGSDERGICLSGPAEDGESYQGPVPACSTLSLLTGFETHAVLGGPSGNA